LLAGAGNELKRGRDAAIEIKAGLESKGKRHQKVAPSKGMKKEKEKRAPQNKIVRTWLSLQIRGSWIRMQFGSSKERTTHAKERIRLAELIDGANLFVRRGRPAPAYVEGGMTRRGRALPGGNRLSE